MDGGREGERRVERGGEMERKEGVEEGREMGGEGRERGGRI